MSRDRRNKVILALDPGFKHGCKLAVINQDGSFLTADTIYPKVINKGFRLSDNDRDKVIKMVKVNRVDEIAIGNGCGCRPSEIMIADLISTGAFHPLKVSWEQRWALVWFEAGR